MQRTLYGLARQTVLKWGVPFREMVAMPAASSEPQLPAQGPHDRALTIALIVPTFKRNQQLFDTLPINVLRTWPLRDTICWIITDFNEDEES